MGYADEDVADEAASSSVSSSSEPATRSIAEFIKSEERGQFRLGMRVRIVSDHWLKLSGIRFEFLCYVTNARTGAEWYEVYGGPRGFARILAVPTDAIQPY